ncbi:hypothetical protein I302_103219 [Kwoniella bestiolae CBS 10118]|uniref:Integral membrane protein n=1 Tax=Kwoniella bestiolae CBS 10118 TaxID=1296100 RepID=A0A1B9G7U7_9TREE|nr:hypothetical protein I302_01918 [Kwoniella bestiolae CBS 10118]OCF27083.1 hypothetical protein I302_01918 [Kwoniella bestiolae CBS 10118]
MAPIKNHDTLVLHKHRSPHPFFTPTHLTFVDPHTGERKGSWSSRRARKGRYAPKSHTIHYAGPSEKDKEVQRIENVTVGRVKREESKLKPHLKADISFWLAISFTLGSMVWVVNGYLVWFPIIRPALDTEPYSKTAAATAFMGGSIFEIGAYLGVVEVLDRGREINFGTALGKLLNHRRSVPRKTGLKLDEIKSHIGTISTSTSTSDEGGAGDDGQDWLSDKKGFVWWGKPMWHDLGYLAAIVQFFAATIFWVSTLTGLPGVIPGFADGGGSQAIIDIFFWTPQVVGGTGFIISSLIIMIEVQKKWWQPNVMEIGWWVGVWNLIGAIGFTLCGALGYASSSSKAEYQSGLSTFWGSWAFLLGSFCQVWEVIWREPSEKDS